MRILPWPPGAAGRSIPYEGLRGRFWTLVHWTNWRMTFLSPPGQQERVARETIAELRAGRAVRLFVTDFPRITSGLAFDDRVEGGALVARLYGPGPTRRQAPFSLRATSGSRSHASAEVHTPMPRRRPEISPVE